MKQRIIRSKTDEHMGEKKEKREGGKQTVRDS